jgi:hypothetical protein
MAIPKREIYFTARYQSTKALLLSQILCRKIKSAIQGNKIKGINSLRKTLSKYRTPTKDTPKAAMTKYFLFFSILNCNQRIVHENIINESKKLFIKYLSTNSLGKVIRSIRGYTVG